MTRRHLRRRSSRRISALGLALSLGLIIGASGIIGVDAAERESPCNEIGEIVKASAHPTQVPVTLKPGPAPHAVHNEGQPEGLQNL